MSEAVLECLPDLLAPDADGTARAVELLRADEVVALPTETVYGLAANALHVDAVRKIFTIKGRPLLDPLIVHGLDAESLANLAHFTPVAQRLANACWPGPLTLVLAKKPVVPDLVTAGRATVAVRAPNHPVIRSVLAACGFPLAAPSANPFGYLSPTRAEHVRASLGERAPWIVDGGPCELGIESTIVDVSDPAVPPRLLRPGSITAEALTAILGIPIITAPVPSSANEPALGSSKGGNLNLSNGLIAPGLLPRHYSPHTPFQLFTDPAQLSAPSAGKRAAWVRLRRPSQSGNVPAGVDSFLLSEDGNLVEAARDLYHLLRRLDEAGYDEIWCEAAPSGSLGEALNDRLRRAAARG